ncbi:hypothetical protein ACGFNX_38510 [Streptomyces sp. NPDC048723]|uniref:hypothetical protein n=1 Tax=Streptomyces sp. NPDC048723 TaxID=3365589 RepID=UPI00371E0CD7
MSPVVGGHAAGVGWGVVAVADQGGEVAGGLQAGSGPALGEGGAESVECLGEVVGLAGLGAEAVEGGGGQVVAQAAVGFEGAVDDLAGGGCELLAAGDDQGGAVFRGAVVLVAGAVDEVPVDAVAVAQGEGDVPGLPQQVEGLPGHAPLLGAVFGEHAGHILDGAAVQGAVEDEELGQQGGQARGLVAGEVDLRRDRGDVGGGDAGGGGDGVFGGAAGQGGVAGEGAWRLAPSRVRTGSALYS